MNYMDVYTPYTLFFVAVITFCVMISALLCSYVAIKVRKDKLFWKHVFVQSALLIWLCGKLLELVSPTQAIMNTHLLVQRVAIFLLFPALLMLLLAVGKQKMDKKVLIRFHVTGIAALACAVSVFFFSIPEWVNDFLPACAFLIWNGFLFFQRSNIFVELSDMSIDVFMDRIEDAILIFDSSDSFIDCNHNAKIIFPFISEACTIRDFYCQLHKRIISGNIFSLPDHAFAEPTEIGVEDSGGIRYFMHFITTVRNKNSLPIATILTFNDVTEKNMLLNELEKKNARLEELNGALRSYIEVAHRLEDEREKTRALMDIQRAIGQSVAEILISLDAVKIVDGQDDTIKDKLTEIIENCRKVMTDIRKSVEG
ncbi:MAG: hypothetical protein KGZ63_13795 [Clostridiales bacterium]|jgi:signal transduction histidine kinase|nr:hypothetical protein [Clostridiales bacterium]